MKSTHIEGDLWSFDEKLATTKKDRLSVRFIDGGKHGFLFYELLWERRGKTKWKRHKTISEFALSPPGTRGALRVHSKGCSKRAEIQMNTMPANLSLEPTVHEVGEVDFRHGPRACTAAQLVRHAAKAEHRGHGVVAAFRPLR